MFWQPTVLPGHVVEVDLDQLLSRFGVAPRVQPGRGNYPPAEPGALEVEPLKAALIVPAPLHPPHSGGRGLGSFLMLIRARTGPNVTFALGD